MLLIKAATLLLLASSVIGQDINCNINSAESLSVCLKHLLNASRDRVQGKFDPLILEDQNRDGVEVWNARVYGISKYTVERLNIRSHLSHAIVFDATIAWPSISADLTAKVRKCKRFLKKFCAQATGDVHISVGRTVGTLSTTLKYNATPDGKFIVTPENTQVGLSLPKIRVKVTLKNKVGRFLNRILGDPVSNIASKMSNKWWGRNRGKIEAKAKAALNRAIKEGVSAKLGNLLKV